MFVYTNVECLTLFPIVNFPFLSSSLPVLTHVQCTYMYIFVHVHVYENKQELNTRPTILYQMPKINVKI